MQNVMVMTFTVGIEDSFVNKRIRNLPFNSPGCKESQFKSVPFGQAVDSMY